MGLIFNKISLTDYTNDTEIYSKLIRNHRDFYIELHHLDGGKKLQLLFYRNHHRIKEFIAVIDKLAHMTEQNSEYELNTQQIRVSINDTDFMISCPGETNIQIQEFNYNKDLDDCAKGKIAVLITFNFNQEIDNSKFVSEVKDYYKQEEEKNNEK